MPVRSANHTENRQRLMEIVEVVRRNDLVKGMTPEKAAGICEVPVEDIYQAARRYATAKPATIAWGLALDQNQNGNQAGQCIVALMAITGNVDNPGGNIIIRKGVVRA